MFWPKPDLFLKGTFNLVDEGIKNLSGVRICVIYWSLVWVPLDENEQVFFLISDLFMNRCLSVDNFQ